MNLADLMRKGSLRRPATATFATDGSQQCSGTVATVAKVAVATAPNSKPANDPALAPDRWCWPHSDAMNTAEIEMFYLRTMHFTSRDPVSAEALADSLVRRDRDADGCCLCFECRHCHPGPHCEEGLAVLPILQWCDHFARHPALEATRLEGKQ